MNTANANNVTRHSVAMHGIAKHSVVRWAKVAPVLLGVCSLCACSVLGQASAPPPALYALDAAPTTVAQAVPAQAASAKLTLVVSPPQAAPGFDSQRIVYLREPHKIEYFAHSEWVDSPARMLAPPCWCQWPSKPGHLLRWYRHRAERRETCD